MLLYSQINTTYHKKYRRIISTVPSLTELLSDLDLEQEVIGITKFCVHPAEWFHNKARVGGTKTLKMEAIKKLQPELIICNKEENTREQVEELSKIYTVLLTDISNLESALIAIRNIGQLTGRIEQANNLTISIESKFLQLKKATAERRTQKAAYLIWKEPFMTAGGDTFINNMMARCGLTNAFSDVDRYPETSLIELNRRGCEMILLSSEPYPFKQNHVAEIKAALQDVQVKLVDGEMFSWYGSRLLKAADYLENLSI